MEAIGILTSKPCTDSSVKILLYPNRNFRGSDAGSSIRSGVATEEKEPFGTSFPRATLKTIAYPT
jgi:hypothetical protein